MAHIRKQIRDEVATILTNAGLTVFASRTHMIQPGELPCVVIRTDNENLESVTQAGYDRDVELTIQLYDRGYESVDDDVDAKCVIIENAMRNDSTLAAHEKNLESINIDIADGDQQIAVAAMVYSIRLFNVENPEQSI